MRDKALRFSLLAVLLTGGGVLAQLGSQLPPEPPSPPATGHAHHEEPQRPEAGALTMSALEITAASLPATDGTWVSQGPGPNRNAQVQNLTPNNEVSGAIHAIVPHPTDANVLYSGGQGGVWRTTNGTAASPTWTPLTDFEQSLSIGALAMDRPTFRYWWPGRTLQLVRRRPAVPSRRRPTRRTDPHGRRWSHMDGHRRSAVRRRAHLCRRFARSRPAGWGQRLLWRRRNRRLVPEHGYRRHLDADQRRRRNRPASRSGSQRFRRRSERRHPAVCRGSGQWHLSHRQHGSNLDARLEYGRRLEHRDGGVEQHPDCRGWRCASVRAGDERRHRVDTVGFSDNQGGAWTQMDVPGTAETALRGRDELELIAVHPGAGPGLRGFHQPGRPFPNSVGATTFTAHMFHGNTTRARGMTGTVSAHGTT